jgi:hypothetical protein
VALGHYRIPLLMLNLLTVFAAGRVMPGDETAA